MPADNAKPIKAIVGYVRVSTAMQGVSGLGLEAQRAAIEDYARRVGAPVAQVFEEVESGARSDRPKLAEAIALCRLTRAALVAARVDRFGRKAADLFALRDADFPVVAVDTPDADGFLFGVLALVAEKEAKAIQARTKAALAAAKARGIKLGNPGNLSRRDVGSANGNAAKAAKASKRTADLLPVIEAIRTEGKASLRQIAAELTARGIPAPRGGAWSAVQVRRVMQRAG